MEVQFTPDLEAKLDQLSGETGRGREELVRDALAGYFDELAQLRGQLSSRYSDLKSGRAALVSSKEIMAHFSQKSADSRS